MFKCFKFTISLTLPSFLGTVNKGEMNPAGSWSHGTIIPLSKRLLGIELWGCDTWEGGSERNSMQSPEIIWRILTSDVNLSHLWQKEDSCPPLKELTLALKYGMRRETTKGGNSLTLDLMLFNSWWISSCIGNDFAVGFTWGIWIPLPPPVHQKWFTLISMEVISSELVVTVALWFVWSFPLIRSYGSHQLISCLKLQ